MIHECVSVPRTFGPIPALTASLTSYAAQWPGAALSFRDLEALSAFARAVLEAVAELAPEAPEPPNRGRITGLSEVCKPAELAEALQVSPALIYGEISRGRLPAVRIGRGAKRQTLLIRRESIKAWLEACKR